MEPQAERVAHNDALFHDATEREARSESSSFLSEFLCECDDPACRERIRLTHSEYEALRARPRHFLLAPAHTIGGVAQVVEQTRRFEIVKRLESGAQAPALPARVRRRRASLLVPAALAASLLGLVVFGILYLQRQDTAQPGAGASLVRKTPLQKPQFADPFLGSSGLAKADESYRFAVADEVLIAAGDITSCTSGDDERTATLVESIPGTVATLGDNAYGEGTPTQFASCYAPSWGRFKDRTLPALGNHDYSTRRAAGYFGYFGAAAGDPSKGYYSYELGAWHIVVLNSDCWRIGGCGAQEPQVRWLRSDLAAHSTGCTLAYWHRPRFSGGIHGGDAGRIQPIWQALYDSGADVALTGHNHVYERFAPMDAIGRRDDARGIREFVVGTGGGGDSRYFRTLAPNTELRDADVDGVLKLTLHASSYDWEFVPAAGETFTDSGSGDCH